jgi:acyl carrier protein
LDFFILFSSFASLVGNPGQGNYVAANTFLEALAHDRRAHGQPALTVNWGALGDVGYVAQNADVSQHFERMGVKLLPSRQALKILGQLLRQEAVQAAVMPGSWKQWARMHAARALPRFSLLGDDVDVSRPQEDAREGGGSSLRDLILATELSERQQLLEFHIREQLARVLEISPSRLRAEQPFIDQGLDSLLAVEVTHRIKAELGVDVPPMKFMEGLSIVSMATFLIEQLTMARSASSTSSAA